MTIRLLLSLLLVVVITGCQSNPDTGSSTSSREIKLETDKYEDSPANVYIELAKAYIGQRQMTIALEHAKTAVATDSQNPYAHNILALIYQNLKQDSKADRHFRAALTSAPNEPTINNSYGSFLCLSGKFDKSLKHFNKTIDYPLYTKKWIPMTNIGICALRNDNLEVAEEYLRKALQNNGKFGNALYNMIHLSVLQKNYLSARAYLQRYLEVGKHNSKTLWWGIQAEQVLGDKDALESYKLILRSKYPDSDEAKLLMAETS